MTGKTQEKKAGTKPVGTPSRVQGVAELVKRLCLAVTNVEMFSAEHPVSKHGIDHAYKWLKALLDGADEDIIVSVAGGNIVIEGMPLEERNPLVSKLAKKFDELHINNMAFEPGVTPEEFHQLYMIIGKGPKALDAEGGFERALKSSGIQRIQLKDVSYVMVSGDEKVVSKDAHVIEADSIAGLDMDSDIVKYMVGKLIEKADEQKWLLKEIKNNPGKMADMITQGIELATSRAEMGLQEDGGIGTLINNIRLVGRKMTEEAADGEESGTEDVEKALLTLESELKLRSSKLMSSKVAVGFVNEIMSVVTSYSDQVRAKEISSEFLKGERSMEKTEALLRNLVPEGEKQENFVLRIAKQLSNRGMTEDDLKQLMDQIKPPEESAKTESAKQVPAAKKRVNDLLVAGIEKNLQKVGLDETQLKTAMKCIAPYLDAASKEKVAEFQREADALRGEVGKRDGILKEVPVGIIIWDARGQVETINAAACAMTGSELGIHRSEAMRKRLKELAFPMTDVPDLLVEKDLNDTDVALLLNVARVFKDKDGEPYGVVLLSS